MLAFLMIGAFQLAIFGVVLVGCGYAAPLPCKKIDEQPVLQNRYLSRRPQKLTGWMFNAVFFPMRRYGQGCF